jgi:hypothetical protein
MNPANMTRIKKRSRSVLEGNIENDLRATIETIRVKISNQEKKLEDARDTPAEVLLLRQLDALRKQLIDLINDAHEVDILGKIINGLIYDGGRL